MQTPSVEVYVGQAETRILAYLIAVYACLYRGYMWRFRRVCTLAQSHQGLRFMHTPSVEVYVAQTETRNLAYLIAVHACL